HYQHTNNPSIFIAFQNCGRLHNKSEWNKWVIFTEKGARYAAHTDSQINVPPRFGEWETVDHWPSGVEEAGKRPAPSIHYNNEEHNRVSNYIPANDFLDETQTEQNEINNQPLSYYKFIPEKMTWNEHNKRAIAMGGNLASISNAIENNKVKEVSKGINVWLGGVRKGCGNDTGADHWYWSNGKKWSYTNWMKNQPDNYHITHNKSEKSENRVHMTPISHGQQWNDISEDNQFSAVYELPIEDDSVDYFENNDIRLKNSNKIIRNPLRIILGSILTSRTGFQLNNIKSIERE
ncbi:MAG: C-type lectin domain-containing protein, partial [Parvicellaceae bacterium]